MKIPGFSSKSPGFQFPGIGIFSWYEISQQSATSAQVLSLISHVAGYGEKFRCPAELESLECAEQLEDADLLRQVLERFQLFGFGTRKCYLSLWTTLQQLICTFCTASSQLSMGSGREEEIEVLCLAVRGLGTELKLGHTCVQCIGLKNGK